MCVCSILLEKVFYFYFLLKNVSVCSVLLEKRVLTENCFGLFSVACEGCFHYKLYRSVQCCLRRAFSIKIVSVS